MHYLAVLHLISIITTAVLAARVVGISLLTTFKAQEKQTNGWKQTG